MTFNLPKLKQRRKMFRSLVTLASVVGVALSGCEEPSAEEYTALANAFSKVMDAAFVMSKPALTPEELEEQKDIWRHHLDENVKYGRADGSWQVNGMDEVLTDGVDFYALENDFSAAIGTPVVCEHEGKYTLHAHLFETWNVPAGKGKGKGKGKGDTQLAMNPSFCDAKANLDAGHVHFEEIVWVNLGAEFDV